MTEPITEIITPIRLEYSYTPGQAASRFLRSVAERRLVGQRCPSCSKVYVPPRGSCPTCGVPTRDEIEVGPQGTITAFCIVNIPFLGQAVECPYVSATIRLDGADIGFYHLIQEIEAGEIEIGMRVEPVWKDERAPTMESIAHFRPASDA